MNCMGKTLREWSSRRLLHLFVGSLLGQALFAQEATISTTLDRAEIAIGERATVTLKIRTNDLENTGLLLPRELFPQEETQTSGTIEVLHYAILDTVVVDNVVREITAKLVFTAFDSTLLEIPPFGVHIGEQESFSDPLFIKVTAPEVDEPSRFNFPHSLKLAFALQLPGGVLFVTSLSACPSSFGRGLFGVSLYPPTDPKQEAST